MIFLFNQTGETLRLRADVTSVAHHDEATGDIETRRELKIVVETETHALIGLLHTDNADIINAAEARFKLGVMDVHPGRLVGHDFYIHKKLTGFDIMNHDPSCMVRMIPCGLDPSTDRDVVRNLVLGIFKVEEGKKVNLRTYDTTDTSMTKIDRVTVTDEHGKTVIYEFRFVAIKWSKWFRLQRPSLLLLKNGDTTKVYKLDAVKSKLAPEILNDWLTELSEEESKNLLEKVKLEQTKIDHVQGPTRMKKNQGGKPGYKNQQGNRRPNNNNRSSRPYNGGGGDKKKYNGNSRPNDRNGNSGYRPKTGGKPGYNKNQKYNNRPKQ